MAYGGGAFQTVFQGDALISMWRSLTRDQFGWNCAARELPCMVNVTQYSGQVVSLDFINSKDGIPLLRCENRSIEVHFHERKDLVHQVMELSSQFDIARIEAKFLNAEIAEGFFRSVKSYFRPASIGQVSTHPQNMPFHAMGSPREFFSPVRELESPLAANGGYNGFASPNRYANSNQAPGPFYDDFDVRPVKTFSTPMKDAQPVFTGIDRSKWMPDPKDVQYDNFPPRNIPPDESPSEERPPHGSNEYGIRTSQMSSLEVQDSTDNAKPTVPISDNIDPLFGVNVKEKDQAVSPLEGILDELAQAIESGNVEKSCALVTNLAEKRARLTMEPIFSEEEKCERNIIKLVVYLEDKVSSGGYFTLDVDPTVTTIGVLKATVYQRLYFPPEVQRWVIGRRLPNDKELLENLGISTSGDTVHLYVSTAREVGIRKREPIAPHELEELESEMSATCNVSTPEKKPQLKQGTQNTLTSSNSETSQSMNTTGASSIETTPTSIIHSSEDDGAIAWPSHAVDPPQDKVEGWNCSFCTLLNLPTRPGCEACGNARPSDYAIPANHRMSKAEEERIRQEQTLDNLAKEAEDRRVQTQRQEAAENFQQLVQTAQLKIVPNPEPFECAICFLAVGKGEGILLRECLHQFCRDCVKMTIMASEEPSVKCPFRDDDYMCPQEITEQEIVQLLDSDEVRRFHERCLNAAERSASNSYHCQSTNCKGWCIYEDEVNYFRCPVCGHVNCLTCRAVHEGKTCKDHQDELKIKAENDQAAKKTQELVQKMLAKGEAMNCPKCGIILQKKEGCDWMRCSMCRIEICWATRGPRWGPAGPGDTSAGCKCRLNGKMCTPQCKNCH